MSSYYGRRDETCPVSTGGNGWGTGVLGSPCSPRPPRLVFSLNHLQCSPLPSPPLYILSPLSAALHSLSSPLSAALHSLSSLLQEDKVLSAKRGEELAHKVRARHPARPPRPRVTSCATLDGMPSGVPGGTRRRATLLLQFPGRIRPPKPNQPKS